MRAGRSWEQPIKWRPRDGGGETSWGHMCVSAGPSRAWVTQGNWRAQLGWAYTCILNLGSVHVSVSLRRMMSHTWLQRWNVTLKMLLSWCPSYSLWDPQLNTHPMPIQWALCLFLWQPCMDFFFVCVRDFLVRGLCYWSLEQYELCKVFSTKVLIDLQTKALFAHLAGKLALLFGKLSLPLQKQRQN